MPRLKKTSIPVNQIDAKDWEAPAPTVTVNPFNEIWGHRLGSFPTTNPQEYEQLLAKMDKADMQNVCIGLGLMPHDNRVTMTERIMKQFKQYVAATIPLPKPKVIIPTEEVSKFLAFNKQTLI